MTILIIVGILAAVLFFISCTSIMAYEVQDDLAPKRNPFEGAAFRPGDIVWSDQKYDTGSPISGEVRDYDPDSKLFSVWISYASVNEYGRVTDRSEILKLPAGKLKLRYRYVADLRRIVFPGVPGVYDSRAQGVRYTGHPGPFAMAGDYTYTGCSGCVFYDDAPYNYCKQHGIPCKKHDHMLVDDVEIILDEPIIWYKNRPTEPYG